MRFLLLIFLCSSLLVQAQNDIKEFESKIEKVTIFLKGAEIHRKAKIELTKGQNRIAFTGLSALLNPSTIQLKGTDFTILSISNKMDFLGEKEKSETVEKLENRKKNLELEKSIELKNFSILVTELDILIANKSIGGNESITAEQLQNVMDYFGEKLRSLENSKLEVQQRINSLSKQIEQLDNEINELISNKDDKTMRIEAVLQAEAAIKSEVELQYIVTEVGWFPSYDIRVDNIIKPINIAYKANVYQNTGIDWKNVRLTISSSNPEQSNTSPTLNPNYLEFDYYSSYNKNNLYQLQQNINFNSSSSRGNINEVYGVIVDENGEPLAGVSVLVQGSTIGTVTDLEGRYKLTLPPNARMLSVSYIGYTPQELLINSSNISIMMTSDTGILEEVIVEKERVKKKKSIL